MGGVAAARFAPFLLLTLAACGRNRDLPPPPPLGPEAYEIAADDRPAEGQYLRYVKAGPKGGGLDVAVTDFRAHGDGPSAHLVGVVHIADADYYARLQRELDGYDVVLFEGIKDAATSGVEWQKRMLEQGGDAGDMQQAFASWFGMRYQLAAIDYARPNLVHADMSSDEFFEAGAGQFGFRRDARPLPTGLLEVWRKFRALGDVVLGVPGPLQSLARATFAEALGSEDIGDSMSLVPGLSELLLDKRNAVAVERFDVERERARGGSIAVFYGAAHMKDLADRLASRGYRRTGARWLRAWALRAPLG